jgi:hypothetical protein
VWAMCMCELVCVCVYACSFGFFFPAYSFFLLAHGALEGLFLVI